MAGANCWRIRGIGIKQTEGRAMRRSVFAFAVIMVSAAALPAAAKDYPWCAVRGGMGEYSDCYYASFEQCKQAIIFSEHCTPNIFNQPAASAPKTAPKRKPPKRTN